MAPIGDQVRKPFGAHSPHERYEGNDDSCGPSGGRGRSAEPRSDGAEHGHTQQDEEVALAHHHFELVGHEVHGARVHTLDLVLEDSGQE